MLGFILGVSETAGPMRLLIARRQLGMILALMAMLIGPADTFANTLPSPTGKPILIIGGAIDRTNVDGEAHLDRAMLEALGLRTLETTNPFETGVQRFSGVLLRDVLRLVGGDDKTMMVASALDGYTVEIPVADAIAYDVLLAMTWNGERMTVRRRGPIWVIYPIDQTPELRDEIFSNRTIWQLKRLTVR